MAPVSQHHDDPREADERPGQRCGGVGTGEGDGVLEPVAALAEVAVLAPVEAQGGRQAQHLRGSEMRRRRRKAPHAGSRSLRRAVEPSTCVRGPRAPRRPPPRAPGSGRRCRSRSVALVVEMLGGRTPGWSRACRSGARPRRSGATRTRLWSTSDAKRLEQLVLVLHDAGAATARAAARSKPPRKTPRRPKSAASRGAAARRSRRSCRAGCGVVPRHRRVHPSRTPRPSSRRASRAVGERSRSRAAASSSARGSPSRRRQMALTVRPPPRRGRRRAPLARARSAKRATEGTSASSSRIARVGPGDRQRLDAEDVLGAQVQRDPAGDQQAQPRTARQQLGDRGRGAGRSCSRLSSTSRTSLSAEVPDERDRAGPRCRSPAARGASAMAAGTSAGSRRAASSTTWTVRSSLVERSLGRLEREAGLAAAARPDERHEPRARRRSPGSASSSALPADERGDEEQGPRPASAPTCSALSVTTDPPPGTTPSATSVPTWPSGGQGHADRNEERPEEPPDVRPTPPRHPRVIRGGLTRAEDGAMQPTSFPIVAEARMAERLLEVERERLARAAAKTAGSRGTAKAPGVVVQRATPPGQGLDRRPRRVPALERDGRGPDGDASRGPLGGRPDPRAGQGVDHRARWERSCSAGRSSTPLEPLRRGHLRLGPRAGRLAHGRVAAPSSGPAVHLPAAMNASRNGFAQPRPGLIDRGSAGGWDEPHADGREGRLDAVLGPQLVLDVGDVDRGGLLADEEPLGDLPVGAALADEGQDLDLAAGQGRATGVERPARPGGRGRPRPSRAALPTALLLGPSPRPRPRRARPAARRRPGGRGPRAARSSHGPRGRRDVDLAAPSLMRRPGAERRARLARRLPATAAMASSAGAGHLASRSTTRARGPRGWPSEPPRAVRGP